MVLFASGGFGTATMLFFADGEALGVSLGVAIDTAKEGVLAADVFVLDATLLGGKAEGDAGTVAVEALHSTRQALTALPTSHHGVITSRSHSS